MGEKPGLRDAISTQVISQPLQNPRRATTGASFRNLMPSCPALPSHLLLSTPSTRATTPAAWAEIPASSPPACVSASKSTCHHHPVFRQDHTPFFPAAMESSPAPISSCHRVVHWPPQARSAPHAALARSKPPPPTIAASKWRRDPALFTGMLKMACPLQQQRHRSMRDLKWFHPRSYKTASSLINTKRIPSSPAQRPAWA